MIPTPRPPRWLAFAAAAVFLLLALAAAFAPGVDLALAGWSGAHRHPWLTVFMFHLTQLHRPAGVLVLAALLVGWMWKDGARRWALLAGLAIPGGLLLNVLLKYAFRRARPSVGEPLVNLASYSFPSGHANGATLLYLTLACWLWARLPRGRARLATAAALAMIVLVAASRVYLGAHYLTDVLAGMAEGTAWLTICMHLAAWRQAPRGAG
ncbi:MAG TPA: phosphatase PAP2 family protein [Telluria sp.]|nr:phosphatase PAP2 family protein [Telluria sp.]